jgi:hypothetical protein
MSKIVSNDWEIKEGPIYYLTSWGREKRIGRYVRNSYENNMYGKPVLKYIFKDSSGIETRVSANDIKNGNLSYDNDLYGEQNGIPTQFMLNQKYGTAGMINPNTGRQLEYGGKVRKSKKSKKSRKSKKSKKHRKTQKK